jgi:hypothetical protein
MEKKTSEVEMRKIFVTAIKNPYVMDDHNMANTISWNE